MLPLSLTLSGVIIIYSMRARRTLPVIHVASSSFKVANVIQTVEGIVYVLLFKNHAED